MNPVGLSVTEAAALLGEGALTAVELLGRVRAARAADGDRFHAFLADNPAAQDEARAADRRRSEGGPLPPLLGIPVAVKDNIDVAGLPTTSGCRALAGAMPRASATVIERLRAAGAVIVGKTNLSEFSFEIRSRSSLGGDVLHPLAPQATAGGSSGGSAVAVTRGYALAALGTDTGGSIRIPAAYNGLVGFRPAHGALPMDGIAPLAPSTDTVGPLARTVADLRLLLAALGRPAAPVAHRWFRVGVMGELFGSVPAVITECEAALERLSGQRVTLVALPPLPAPCRPDHGDHIVDAEFAAAFDGYLRRNFMPGTAPQSLAELVASGAFLPDHAAALAARMAVAGRETKSILARHRALAAQLAAWRQALRLDALAYPTSQVLPTDLGNPRGGWGPELAARSGWPAITVCAGRTEEGMPVGLEFLAPPGQEGVLLELAARIERTRP